MAKDAKGHGSDGRGGAGNVPGYTSKGAKLLQAATAASNARTGNQPIVEVPAHTQGVAAVGQPADAPKFGMNSYTHTINDPQGNEIGRLNLGKNNGVGLDLGKGVQHNSGMAFHDAVSMAAYRSSKGGNDSFPAEKIGGELHYMTGQNFAGHTVNRTVAGGKKYGHLAGE